MRLASRQEIKHCQFLFREVLGSGALVLLIEITHKVKKPLKIILDTNSASVVFRNHLLKFFLIVHTTSVETNHRSEFGVDRASESLCLDAFVLCLKLFT